MESVFADDRILMADDHFDAVGWDPLITKFTQYFGRGEPLQQSTLARGWGMPPLPAYSPA